MSIEPDRNSPGEVEYARQLLDRASQTLSLSGAPQGRLTAPLQRLRLAREQLENKLLKLRHFRELSRQAEAELAEACSQLREEYECVRLRTEPPSNGPS